jgi:hypothetical protein
MPVAPDGKRDGAREMGTLSRSSHYERHSRPKGPRGVSDGAFEQEAAPSRGGGRRAQAGSNLLSVAKHAHGAAYSGQNRSRITCRSALSWTSRGLTADRFADVPAVCRRCAPNSTARLPAIGR